MGMMAQAQGHGLGIPIATVGGFSCWPGSFATTEKEAQSLSHGSLHGFNGRINCGIVLFPRTRRALKNGHK